MTTSGQAPFQTVLMARLAAAGATADTETVIGYAPADGKITSVQFLPDTVLTGADTNSRTIAVKNAGQSGSGTTAVASKDFTNGVNAAAKDATALTLSGTAANLVVAAGDVLYAVSTHVGASGLAQPAGAVRVVIDRD